MELAKLKKAWLIAFSTGDKETVLLETKPDRDAIIKEKKVVSLDGMTINGSYISYVKEININDSEMGTAMAYANTLKGAIGATARERVRRYELSFGGKMPLSKLKKRLLFFAKDGKTLSMYEYYLEEGGDPSQIG